jgi:hypothetical protein
LNVAFKLFVVCSFLFVECAFIDDTQPVKPAPRDQMQLHLTKENESPENDSARRRNAQKVNQDSPPKIRKF